MGKQKDDEIMTLDLIEDMEFIQEPCDKLNAGTMVMTLKWESY